MTIIINNKVPEGSTVGLCLSGGLDSSAAWWAVGKPDWFFVPSANALPTDKERVTVKRLCEISPEFAAKGRTIEFDMDKVRRPKTRYPRHVVLTAIGIGAGFDEVWFGLHRWDPQHGEWPKTEDGIDIIQSIFMRLNYSNHRIAIRYPVANLDRVELIQEAMRNGCSKEFLEATWSCQYANELHCGHCHNCVERYLAFREVGLDLNAFAEKPTEAEMSIKDFTAAHAFNIGNTKLLRELIAINNGKPVVIEFNSGRLLGAL